MSGIAGRPIFESTSRLNEREARLWIDGFMERTRGLGEYDFERRAHVRLNQMPTVRRPVASPDNDMRMDRGLAILERDISNE